MNEPPRFYVGVDQGSRDHYVCLIYRDDRRRR